MNYASYSQSTFTNDRVDNNNFNSVIVIKKQLAELTLQLFKLIDVIPENISNEISVDPHAPMRTHLTNAISMRHRRNKLFPKGLFAEPAWDILLDLALARLDGRRISVSSLCIAAFVPTTTALRWIKAMIDSGLIYRESDPHDGRRHYVFISDACYNLVASSLTGIRHKE